MSAISAPLVKKRVSKGSKGAASTARKVVLEKVIGNTIVHNSAFACNPATGDLAYPAGCVIVIYSPKKNKQVKFLSNKENKTISFLRFSANGKYLAVGESGHRPAVYVWDTTTWAIVSELRGHKYGVSCGCFSPNNKYLVTVGFQHDATLFVWDWKAGMAAAGNKITTKVYSVSFSEDGTYFVTAGFRHIKFWYLDSIGPAKASDKNAKVSPGQTAVIEGKAGVLGAQRDSLFLDVVCGQGAASNLVFSVTSKGLVCQFSSNRIMEKWVNLKANRVFALAISPTVVACACSDGLVRLFEPTTLDYVTTIHKPHAIGKEAAGPSAGSPEDVLPDALAIQLSSDSQRLSVVYTDRTLTVWDISTPKKSGLLRSFLAHCACIWDIAVCPDKSPLPEGSFITCGADNTIRVWNIDSALGIRASVNVEASVSSVRAVNKESLQTIHVGNDTSIFKARENVDMRTSTEMLPTVSNDTGIRCVAISSDGTNVASGDRQGNLRIFSVPDFKCILYKEVHDAEILTLDYSSPPTTRTPDTNGSPDRPTATDVLLATASRDRLVHIFNASKNYDLMSTLDDHSSSITAVKFAAGGTRLFTCSADKSIVFRSVEHPTPNTVSIKRYHHAVIPYGTLYDMDVDPTQKYLVSAGQDKKLSIYTLNQPKVIRAYKTDLDSGEILKVSLDPAGIYAVTSCADKMLRIYDFYSGECLARMTGHSELVTGVKFTRDCKRIISVSADGCIFVWKLSQDFTKSMKDRLAERNPENRPSSSSSQSGGNNLPIGMATPMHAPSANLPNVSPIHGNSNEQDTSLDFHPVPPSGGEMFGKDQGDVSLNESIMPKFKFSETALPSWAKEDKPKEASAKLKVDDTKPKGRWAQRAESNEAFTLYSDLGEEDKPVVKWGEKDHRRLTIEPDSMNDSKWASPSAQHRFESRNAKDLLIADMDSSLTHPLPNKPLLHTPLSRPSSAEDDDTVLVDHEMMDLDDDNPRMRASQVGALLEDDDEEIKEEKEETDEEEKDDQPIYFKEQTEDTSKGFEVAKPAQALADKNVPESAAKQEDEEEFEDASLKDLSDAGKEEEEDEAFRKMYEKYDFIKSNFDNLSSAPAKAHNPMRLSISRKFLEQPDTRTSDEKPALANQGNTSGNTSGEESAAKSKKFKEPLSKEVEKTRERLARMGIVLPSAQAAGKTLEPKEDATSTTSLSPSSSLSPTSAAAPQPSAQASFPQNRAPPRSPPRTSSPQTLSPTATATSRISPPQTLVPTETQESAQAPSVADSQVGLAATQASLRASGTTLRRPISEYESALGSLAASLNHTLQMWKEVRESASASDPTANYLSGQFQTMFASISGQIAQVDPSLTATFSQPAVPQAPADPLEKYSDLLVERVVQKLGSMDVQNKFLQSLTSSFKGSGSFN